MPTAQTSDAGPTRLGVHRLFRAHVGRRSDRRTGLGDVRAVGAPRDSEVQQLDLFPAWPVDNEHVVRLQVAMDNAPLVGRSERL